MSQTPSKEVNHVVARQQHTRLHLLLGVVLLIGMGGLGALFWQLRAHTDELRSGFRQVEASLAAVEQRLDKADKRLGVADQQQLALKEEQNRLQHAFSQMTDYTQADWLISESAYLGNLAVARLQTSKDVPTALKQLQYAQSRLGKLSDPNLLPLKERLAKDIAQLEEIQSLDWEKVWVSLGTLSDSIERLPFQVGETVDTAAAGAESEAGWEAHLAQAWGEIKSLVKVRRQSDAATLPLVTTSDKQLYVHSMQFLIEEARWAVIHRNQRVYQDALRLLRFRLKAQFDMTSTKTQAFEDQIAQLQSIDMQVFIPDLSELVRLFDQVQARRTGGA